MKRKLVVAAVLIAVLLGLFLYFFCNGLVLIDGKPALLVRLDLSEDRKHILVPVVATLCEMGYEKISEEDGIIELQNEDQIATLNLSEKTLFCPQSVYNCIGPMPGNGFYYCERKGNDIMLDVDTFSGTLAGIYCNYVSAVKNPRARIVTFEYFEREEIDIAQLIMEVINTRPEEEPTEEKPDIVTNARLIVNGVDITEGNHVRIHHGFQNAEIPLVATLQALGHEIDIEYDESRNCYEAIYNGETMYTTAKQDFNIPLSIGESGCIRKIECNDFIVDTNCISTQLYWIWQADITIDYDTSTIYVDSCDPWA